MINLSKPNNHENFVEAYFLALECNQRKEETGVWLSESII